MAENASTGGLDRSDSADQPEDQIAGLFETYVTGFNDYDCQAIVDCFALPATIWQFGKGHVFSSAKALAENTDALLSALSEEKVTHSEFDVVSSHVSGSTAMITLEWRQENASNEAILEFTCHYHLISDGADWRIAMVINE